MAVIPPIDRSAMDRDAMKIFFSVGEPSGDLHGANLVRALRSRRPDVEYVGYGGPRMAAAGCCLHSDLTQLALMGFVRVFLNLHRFWSLYRRAKRYFRQQRPDAVVLIDYPGFNWWIARAAKRENIPVFYYGVPQLWAWAGWRIRKMRRFVDHVMCKLPFERDWYQARGCHATFVGHPYYDQLFSEPVDKDFISQLRSQEAPLVTILPGSRNQEVEKNLTWFLKAAQRVLDQVPHVRFAVAAFNQQQADMAAETIETSGVPADVHVGRTPELIQAARCCMACSGSVSLELLYHAKPSVILYWVDRFPYTMARAFFMRVRFITLVNLLASDEPLLAKGEKYDPLEASDGAAPFPEYLTYDDCSSELAAHIVDWILNDHEYQSRIRRLTVLKEQFAVPGASETAASYILDALGGTLKLAGPHFELGRTRGRSKIGSNSPVAASSRKSA